MKVDMARSAFVEELHVDPLNWARVADCVTRGLKGMAESPEFLFVELIEV
jgi:hypothetical protein